jgi:hypothetical protein
VASAVRRKVSRRALDADVIERGPLSKPADHSERNLSAIATRGDSLPLIARDVRWKCPSDLALAAVDQTNRRLHRFFA